MTKPLRHKLLGDEVIPEDEGDLPAELLFTEASKVTKEMYEVTKSLGDDEDIIHGELYLDSNGKAHFICHTPGNMSFVEVREALSKFIDLFLDQIEREEECPF